MTLFGKRLRGIFYFIYLFVLCMGGLAAYILSMNFSLFHAVCWYQQFLTVQNRTFIFEANSSCVDIDAKKESILQEQQMNLIQ
jgi:hypothetical protein